MAIAQHPIPDHLRAAVSERYLDVEDELLKLKRQGIEIDKSELVDALLGAWVKWRQGEQLMARLLYLKLILAAEMSLDPLLNRIP